MTITKQDIINDVHRVAKILPHLELNQIDYKQYGAYSKSTATELFGSFNKNTIKHILEQNPTQTTLDKKP